MPQRRPRVSRFHRPKACTRLAIKQWRMKLSLLRRQTQSFLTSNLCAPGIWLVSRDIRDLLRSNHSDLNRRHNDRCHHRIHRFGHLLKRLNRYHRHCTGLLTRFLYVRHHRDQTRLHLLLTCGRCRHRIGNRLHRDHRRLDRRNVHRLGHNKFRHNRCHHHSFLGFP